MALLPSLGVAAGGGGSGPRPLGPSALRAEAGRALTAVAAATAPAAAGPPVAADAAAGAVSPRGAGLPVVLLTVLLLLLVLFLVTLGPLVLCVERGQKATWPLPGGP